MSWNFFTSSNRQTPVSSPKQGGFGLVELMISISIMMIVSAIILIRQDSFNGALLLRSEAYDIALKVREVQLSAVSVSGDSSLGNFRSTLGIHFSTNPGQEGQYRIFRDADSDNFYDAGAGEEYGAQGILDPRFVIEEIRLGNDVESDLSVIFERPNFDARFFTSSGVESSETVAKIDIRRRGTSGNTTGELRTLEITATGQIAVQ